MRVFRCFGVFGGWWRVGVRLGAVAVGAIWACEGLPMRVGTWRVQGVPVCLGGPWVQAMRLMRL